ncbi:MAG: FlgD immunoglobulin-like domain containing protein [Fidelibacterota bacterium]
MKTVTKWCLYLGTAQTLLWGQAPLWTVNPSEYQFTANVTALVQLDYVTQGDSASYLGAFVNDTCRGVVQPVNVLGSWMYFLTLYSNQSQEDMSLKYYSSLEDTILPISEAYTFTANTSLGTPTEPINYHIFLYYDHTPLVSGILDQTIEDGSSFTSFDLDDYLTEEDGDSITWSVMGMQYLNVTLDSSHVVTVTPVTPGWVGSETIVFTVTDVTSNGFHDSDTAQFIILPLDHPPVVGNIPGQVIGNGGSFAPIVLSDYVSEQDGDSIAWSYGFDAPVEIDTIPSWSVNPADFVSTMTVTARVTSRGEAGNDSESILAAFVDGECRGVVSGVPALGEWLYFLTVYANVDGETIHFRFYNSGTSLNEPVNETLDFIANDAEGTPEAPYNLTAGFLDVTISSAQVAQITVLDPAWSGTESIRFVARDVGTLNTYTDSTSALFTILPDHTPLVSGILDQTIEDGSSFTSFDLDDYLTEEDGDSITWSVMGMQYLNVTLDSSHVVTVTPVTPGWVGSETIVFTVTDVTSNGFHDSDTATFTILSQDHAPTILAIPADTIGIGGEFQNINLDNYLIEEDGQSVSWSYAFAPSSNPQPAPNWSVNAAEFQYNMSLTTRIMLREQESSNSGNLLGAFVDGECRGIAQPMQVLDQSLYFLTIFGNNDGDNVTFRIYDADRGDSLLLNDTIPFINNDVIGSPESPFELVVSQIAISFLDSTTIQPEWVGSNRGGTENIYIIATDVGTEAALSDSAMVSFTLVPQVFPTVLDIPSQTIEEGEHFTVFDLDDFLDYQGDVNWTISGQNDLIVSMDSNHVVTITTPDENWFGEENIRYTASDVNNDQLSDWQETLYIVQAVNDLPVFMSDPILTVLEDEQYMYRILVEDVDNDTLVISANLLPDWLSLSNDTLLVGTPSNQQVGTHPAELSVWDHVADPVIQSFIIEVINTNDPPQLVTPFQDQYVMSDDSVHTIFENIVDNFYDEDLGDDLTYSSDILGSGLDSVAIHQVETDSVAVVVYLQENFIGTVDMTLRATDNNSAFVEDTLTVFILQTNRPPVFTSDPVLVVSQDQEYRYKPEILDMDENPVTLTIDTLPEWLDFVGDSLIIGTPTNDDVGEYNAIISTTDGLSEPVYQAWTITVENINDAPVAIANTNFSTLAGVVVELNGEYSYDIDGDSLSFKWISLENIELTHPLSPNPSLLVPDVNDLTELQFVLIVSDYGLASVPDTMTVTVHPADEVDITDYSNAPQDAGSDLGISVAFPDYFYATEATLYYTVGGERGFQSIPMTQPGRGLIFTAVIPGSRVSGNGLAHYISAIDSAGVVFQTDVASIPVIIPEHSISITMESSAYPAGIPEGKWRIISSPILPDDPTVETILADVFGRNHSNKTWQVFDWNGENWFTPDTLEAGKGYWLNQRMVDTVEFSVGAGTSVALSGFNVMVNPGWNLISSPFPFPIGATIDQELFSGPYSYGDFDGEGWKTTTDSLRPWGGYAVYNWSDSIQSIALEPLTDLHQNRAARQSDGWIVNLSVSKEGYADNTNRIGQSSVARDGKDALDNIEPPNQSHYLKLELHNNDLDDRITTFTSDIRSIDTELQSWTILISSNVFRGLANVNMDLLGDFPTQYSRFWLDLSMRNYIDITNRNSIQINVQNEFPSRYTVITGPTSQVKQAAEDLLSTLPQSYALAQNYPNPFNGQTQIHYTLEKPSDVKIIIYNIRGQAIQTLIQKRQDFGDYQVAWDGTNTRHVPVSSGMYFYRITARSLTDGHHFNQTKKMVFIQ